MNFPPFKKLTFYQDSETLATDHTSPIWKDIESAKLANEISKEVRYILNETIMTDNEILARFESLQPQNEDGTGFVHEDEDGLTWGYNTPDELEYHKKFSWLMPVWYKFRELKIADVERAHVHKNWSDEIGNAILHSGCAEACNLLAEGIRWYNSIKK